VNYRVVGLEWPVENRGDLRSGELWCCFSAWLAMPSFGWSAACVVEWFLSLQAAAECRTRGGISVADWQKAISLDPTPCREKHPELIIRPPFNQCIASTLFFDGAHVYSLRDKQWSLSNDGPPVASSLWKRAVLETQWPHPMSR
jgi:hypothetical protein